MISRSTHGSVRLKMTHPNSFTAATFNDRPYVTVHLTSCCFPCQRHTVLTAAPSAATRVQQPCSSLAALSRAFSHADTTPDAAVLQSPKENGGI
jgi:hypothetical protein